MKLKVTQRKVIQEETDIDLPIYLCTQDESCNDKYVKWDGVEQTIIEQFWFGFSISKSSMELYIEDYELRNLITESQFNESYEEALSFLTFSRENK
jgi:hypothetical protein